MFDIPTYGCEVCSSVFQEDPYECGRCGRVFCEACCDTVTGRDLTGLVCGICSGAVKDVPYDPSAEEVVAASK